MLDLDDLQQHWAAYDRKLDTIVGLNRQLLMAAHMNKVRSPLQRLMWFLIAESVVQLAVVVVLGSFVFNNIAALRFALPGAALGIIAIVLLIMLVRQIIIVRQIDYLVPIATIQAHIGALRILSIRNTQFIFLVAPLIWGLFVIVAFRGFWGLDTYRLFGYTYLLAQVAFGAAIIPLAIWLSRRFADRMRHAPLMQRVMRDIAGYNLNVAADALATLSAFAEEPRGN